MNVEHYARLMNKEMSKRGEYDGRVKTDGS